MDIIFYRYKSIYEPDCLKVFNSFNVGVTELNAADYPTHESQIKAISELYLNRRENGEAFLFLFSINFFPVVSDICEKLGLIYVCWSVDCPVNELLLKQVRNRCNRIFLFDYTQYERIHRHNPGGTFYLPLATDTDRLDLTNSSITDNDKRQFTSDISFVGSLYSEKNPLKEISLSDFSKGFIDGLIASQLGVFGCNFIEDALPLNVIENILGNDFAYNSETMLEPLNRYIAAHSYIGMELAERERISTLNYLAKYFNVDLYTQSDTSPLINVNNKGPANSLTQMPKIFRLSKINLNITMRPIQTGLSLRVFDVLGSGGFLITNYQAEISSLYEIGTDLETYSSLEELKDKCSYYLTHDEERERIALNGYKKTKELHNIHNRIKTMFEYLLGDRK